MFLTATRITMALFLSFIPGCPTTLSSHTVAFEYLCKSRGCWTAVLTLDMNFTWLLGYDHLVSLSIR